MKFSSPKVVMTLKRRAFKKDKCIYLLVANKPIKYQVKRSKVIYIGTTKKGASRVSQSVVARGEPALGKHGITHIEAFVVSCKPRNKVSIWKKLEAAFVLAFRREHGAVPLYNNKLKYKKRTDEFEYFNEKTIAKTLSKFER